MQGKLIMSVADIRQDNGRAKWEALRIKSIGGSDAACILGMNPWKSAYALWAEKTGLVMPEDISDNEYVYWGTVLEDVVANRFCELTGKKVRRVGMLADNEFDFMTANIDRSVEGENAGLECKTANGFKAAAWEGDEVPDAYYIQCQWYMMITGCEKWYIACLIGGNHFVWKEIPRNEEDIKAMREKAIDFWNKVQNKVPPEVDGSESTSDTINKLHPVAEDNSIMYLPGRAGECIARLDQLAVTEKLIKEEKEKLQNEIKNMLGDVEQGAWEDRKVSWKNQAGRTTIDSKRLMAELPDIYKAYAKVGKPTRVFRLK